MKHLNGSYFDMFVVLKLLRLPDIPSNKPKLAPSHVLILQNETHTTRESQVIKFLCALEFSVPSADYGFHHEHQWVVIQKSSTGKISEYQYC